MEQLWQRGFSLPNGDLVELRNENFFVLFPASSAKANGKQAEGDKVPPKMLRRGYPKHVAIGEEVRERKFDHCVLVVPGAMSEKPLLSSLGFLQAGDERGSLIDCVDTMRLLAKELIAANFEGVHSLSAPMYSQLSRRCFTNYASSLVFLFPITNQIVSHGHQQELWPN